MQGALFFEGIKNKQVFPWNIELIRYNKAKCVHVNRFCSGTPVKREALAVNSDIIVGEKKFQDNHSDSLLANYYWLIQLHAINVSIYVRIIIKSEHLILLLKKIE